MRAEEDGRDRSKLNQSQISRGNIKKNTKSLLGEIKGVDQEIAALQGTLINELIGQSQQTSALEMANEANEESDVLELLGGSQGVEESEDCGFDQRRQSEPRIVNFL